MSFDLRKITIRTNSILDYVCNRKLWFVLGGLCIYISIGFLIRIKESKFSKRDTRQGAFVEYISTKRFGGHEPLMAELNLFKGTEALVLPTVWNAFPEGDVALLKDMPLELFNYFPERIYLNDTVALNNIPFSKTEGEAMDEIISNKLSEYIGDYGRDYTLARGGDKEEGGISLQCTSLLGGEVLEKMIILSESEELLLFEPVEFLILNYVGGGVREPLMIRSSGQEELDKRLINMIRDMEWLKALGPGYYMVQINS